MTACYGGGLAAKRMDIQVLLRHSTIDTTPMDTYVGQERMEQGVNQL